MLALRAAQAPDPASAGAAPEPAELAMQLQTAMLQAPGGASAEVLQPRRSSTGDLLVCAYGRATHICVFQTAQQQSVTATLLTDTVVERQARHAWAQSPLLIVHLAS